MPTRKELKKAGKDSLKRHYLVFVLICVMAAFIGTHEDNIFSTIQLSTSPDPGVAQTGTTFISVGFNSVWANMLQGNLEKGEEEAKKNLQDIENRDTNRYLGRKRGVLAQIVNSFSSGAILVTIVSALNSIVKSTDVAIQILVFFGLLFVGAVWALVLNLYSAVSARIFLEGRVYEVLPIRRFVFFLSIRKWFRAAWILMYKYILLTLWSFTVIGAVIKTYSYHLVPYIVAENSDMSARTAVTLSRRMMKGHKWECFKLDFSFLGWKILNVFTMGLVGCFYLNPYYEATMAEYYYQLRKLAKENKVPGSELLNDQYLYEKPSDEVLRHTYTDFYILLNAPDSGERKLTGLRATLANLFGIVFYYGKKHEAYEDAAVRNVKTDAMKNIISGKEYPFRLYPISRPAKVRDEEGIRYLRYYSVTSLITLFFLLSFVGWLWEVSLHLIVDGEFINRGVLHGPWLPIYGTGGVLILLILNKFRVNPLKEFIATVILCGCVEYFASWYLEIVHHGMKWWDYSGYFLNVNGRICAEGLLVFGLGGIAIVYLIAPLADNLFRKVRTRYLVLICAFLTIAFSADYAYSSRYPNTGKGITDYQTRITSGTPAAVSYKEAGRP